MFFKITDYEEDPLLQLAGLDVLGFAVQGVVPFVQVNGLHVLVLNELGSLDEVLVYKAIG